MTSDQERAAPAQQPVADDIVEKLFVDLRGRRYLKWIFSEHGDKCLIERAESGEWVTGISLDVQDEIRAEWRRIAASSIASSEPELVSLQAEVERLTADRATVARIWKSLGIKTYEEAGGREISEIVADLTSRVEALSAEVGTARAAAFEEAAQIADVKAAEYEAEAGMWPCAPPIAVRLRGLAAAIRSRAALEKGATT